MEQTYVRTSIRLPLQTHTRLTKQAFTQKKSLNKVMLEKLDGGERKMTRWERFQEDEKELNVIRRKYAKEFSKIDSVEAVRQLRDGRAEAIWGKSH